MVWTMKRYLSDYINELYEKGIINKDREMKLTFPY